MKNAFIAFCSPAGSTRHVAGVMAKRLEANFIAVHMLDMGAGENPSRFVSPLKTATTQDCLFVGSPVYRDVAIPPVMAFLNELPSTNSCSAVPFVTWGGALSGIALWQMGQVLFNKGYALVGAAKVLGVHSMMWQADRPVGHGHPNDDDDRQVATLVDRVADRISATTPESLPLASLDYQPEAIGAGIKKKLDQPWMVIPKRIDAEACTQCGICADVCPVGTVALDPGPVFGDNCFDCFNCVRECPEEAIISSVPLEKIDSMIRQRVETFNERPLTQIF